MKSTKRFTTTPEAAQARQAEALARLEDAVSALRDSEGMRNYLRFQARFHRYSLNNVLLIQAQYPTATRVAGYRAWQGMGRQVRKGEKGIVILAPNAYKATDRDSGEEYQAVRGFHTASVFALEQTDGADLPDPPQPTVMDGDEAAAEALIARLLGIALTLNYHVGFAHSDDPVNGCCNLSTQRIVVNTKNGRMQQAKTLLHELMHAFLGSRGEHPADRATGEVVVEGMAFIVADWLKLDTTRYSVPYIAGWQEDGDALKQNVALMAKAASAFIALLDRAPGASALHLAS